MPTTSLMPTPKQQFFDANGDPLVGGNFYTFAAGTNTPKDTFTDSDGIIAQPNPVPLNVRGEPNSAIHWTGAYKVELRDALGNLIYTVDNFVSTDQIISSGQGAILAMLAASSGSSTVGFIQSATGAQLQTVQDELRKTVRVTQFGGTDTAAAQAALTSVMVTGGRVIFPSGRTYSIDGVGLNVYANTEVVIEGGAIVDISAMATGATAFNVDGSEGTNYLFTGNSGPGESTVSISAANLSASGIVSNDWVRISSNAQFDPQRTQSEIGELIQVSAINLGTGVVSFWTKIQDTYLVADVAVISKVTLLRGVSFSGCGKILDSRNNLHNHNMIHFFRCYAPQVVGGLFFEKSTGAAIWFQDCIKPLVDNADFEDFWSTSRGYGVVATNATQDGLFTNIRGNRIRHLFTTGCATDTNGQPRRNVVDGFIAINSATASGGSGGDAVDTHAVGEWTHIRNGLIIGSSSQGINFEAPSGSIENVWVFDSVGNGVGFHNESNRPTDFSMNNVHVYNSGNHGIQINGFGITATPTNERVILSNISSRKTSVSGIGIYLQGGALKFQSAQFSNLAAYETGSDSGGIFIDGVTNFTATGLIAQSPLGVAAGGIRIRDCVGGVIDGVVIGSATGATGLGMYVQASTPGSCADITINGVFIQPGAYANLRGILLDNNAQQIRIGSGNNFRNATVPITAGTGTSNKVNFDPYSVTYTVPSLGAGLNDRQLIAVPGVELGDIMHASLGVDMQGMVLSAFASGTNAVRVQVDNITAATINVGAKTLRLIWQRPGV